jgi:hypothetical protein
MGSTHGIGIKRNDYHRRNRKRNISMHSHKHGYQKPSKNNQLLPSVEVIIKRLPQAELVRKAQESHPTWRGDGIAIEEVCFRYVRHALTNYDLLLKNNSIKGDGKGADNYIYMHILRQICNAINDTYLWLSKEAAKFYRIRLKLKTGIRVIKKDTPTLSQLQVAEFNEKEEERWKNILQKFDEEEHAEEVNLTEALSSLASERLLYFPPFLKKEEIIKRRFESGDENNDRWWEWEEELKLKTYEGRPHEVL